MWRWFLVALVSRATGSAIPSMKREEAITECGKPWELRKGADNELIMVANYAAHVASQQFKFERKDVLVRLIGGFIKDCQYPKYRIEAEFTASNCTLADTPSYEPADCIALPGAPIKYCKIYLFVPKHSGGRLVSYDCEEQHLGPNWKPHEMASDGLLRSRNREPQYMLDERLEAVPSGTSPFFLLFCAFLPVAGLVVLYRIW